MAENDTNDGSSQGAQPGFDMDALGAMLDQKVQDGVSRALRANAPAPKPQAPPVADPIGDMVRPYVEPHLKAAQLLAEAANDKADFYAGAGKNATPDEIKEVETAFIQMAQQGRPMSRTDLLAWHRGKDPDKLVDRVNGERKAAADKAAQMADVGGGRGAANVQAVDPYSMDHEKLTQALQGVSF